MTLLPWAIITLVAAQRVSELAWARRNTKRLKSRGAVEVGADHYPLIVLMHIAWFAAMIVFLPHPPTIAWSLIVLFLLLQIGRGWVLVTLGPYFTTRVMTLHGAPLMRAGPYRFVRHPNYLIVAGEILVLPLALNEVGVAVLFTTLNTALLFWRIRVEDCALASRRHIRSS